MKRKDSTSTPRAKRLAHDGAKTMAARIETLGACERTVLEWVSEGKRNDEIAAILGRSPSTIANQVSSILRKLGVETRGAAGRALLDHQNGNGASRKPPRRRRK